MTPKKNLKTRSQNMKKKKIPFQRKKKNIYSYALACLTKLPISARRQIALPLFIYITECLRLVAHSRHQLASIQPLQMPERGPQLHAHPRQRVQDRPHFLPARLAKLPAVVQQTLCNN